MSNCPDEMTCRVYSRVHTVLNRRDYVFQRDAVLSPAAYEAPTVFAKCTFLGSQRENCENYASLSARVRSLPHPEAALGPRLRPWPEQTQAAARARPQVTAATARIKATFLKPSCRIKVTFLNPSSNFKI